MPQTAPITIRHKRLIVGSLLGLHAMLLAWGALRQSPTVDEPMHLVAGLYHWQIGCFDLDRGNPPLTGLVSALPVLWADPETNWSAAPNSYGVSVRFFRENGLRTCWLVTLGRWACIPFSLLGGYICYRWSTELFGQASGLTALTLWCFSPNTLAYGQLITGDMPATAMGVTASYFFWQWLRRPGVSPAIYAGLTMGLAELTKMLWVVLYVLWPLLWILWFLTTRRKTGRPSFLSQLIQMAAILLVCLYVLNLGYAFYGSFSRLERFRVGRLLLELCSEPNAEQRPRASTMLAGLRVPLPKDYVDGIDMIVSLSKSKPASYLRREWWDGGHWCYYPYAVLVKLPAGALALGIVAAVFTLCFWRRKVDWRSESMILGMIVVIFAFVSNSGMLQTFRYLLPFLPYAIIWISKSGRVLTEGRRWHVLVASMLLLWAVLSGLHTYPHSLSYFNEPAGGPPRGHLHLIGADADHGQDFLFLKRWLEQHPEASPLGMAWRHPLLDPRHLEIDYITVPRGVVAGQDYSLAYLYGVGPQPGWYAIDVNSLRDRSGCYSYFHCFEPVGHAGYSTSIYHITPEEANRVRKRLGLPELLVETEP